MTGRRAREISEKEHPRQRKELSAKAWKAKELHASEVLKDSRGLLNWGRWERRRARLTEVRARLALRAFIETISTVGTGS